MRLLSKNKKSVDKGSGGLLFARYEERMPSSAPLNCAVK